VLSGDYSRDRKLLRRLSIALLFASLAGAWSPFVAEAQLAAAVLPASRSVQVGTAATAFATIINAGSATATGCSLASATSVPATFTFQTTNPATNQVTGTANTPVDIPAGASQSFVFALTPTAPFTSTDVALTFACSNAPAAPSNSGLNTLLLSSSTTPTPDVVALAATLDTDGIVKIPGTTGTGVFAVATVNVGATGGITASADTGTATLPVALTLCQTDQTTGACLGPAGATVATTINAGATPTFGVFVTGSGDVPFSPAANRIVVRFRDAGGEVRGATSVAVQTQNLSGVAAVGRPLADTAVTVKDRNGVTRSTTTNAAGGYTIDVSGLTPPFLLRVDVPGGSPLFSARGQIGVANIHLFSDLIVGTFFRALGLTPADVFNALAGSASLPGAVELELVERSVRNIIRRALLDRGVDSNTFDLISTPFAANGTGFDDVLQHVTISPDRSTVSLVESTRTQTTTLAVDVPTGTLTVNTTTITTSGESTSSSDVVVIPTPPVQTALAGVTAALAQLKATVNAKGAALTSSDLLDFLDPNYLDRGFNRALGAAKLATNLRGLVISFRIDRVLAFDAAARLIRVAVTALTTRDEITLGAEVSQDAGGVTFKQQADGTWRLAGDQRIAQARVRVKTVRNQLGDPCCDGVFKVISLQVSAPQGVVSSAMVTGGGFTSAAMPKNPATFVETLRPTPTTTLDVVIDHFDVPPDAPGGTAVTSFPPAGTLFTFTVTPQTGPQEIFVDRVRATTTEAISVTSPTGHALADARLGQPLTLTFTLPTTFPIAEVELNASVSAAGVSCEVDGPDLAVTATTGTITLPTTCAGNPVVPLGLVGCCSAGVNVRIFGVNGEETVVQYQFR
jgi:hypothetical protein